MNIISINIQGVGDLAKRRWLGKLCNSHMVNFLSVQETKKASVDLWVIRQIWGNMVFDFASSSARGQSGGNRFYLE